MKQLYFYKIIIVGVFISTLLAQICLAMTSENYQISQDSINFSGIDLATSTNYKLDDTMGEVGTGYLNSTNYLVGIGYRRMITPEPLLSFSISANRIELGHLDYTKVNTDSHTFTVTSNAPGGYEVVVYEDGELRTDNGDDINDVADGAVSFGSEEYGISTAGSDGQYNAADTAVSNGKVIASNASWVTDQMTTVNYKASVNPMTAGGFYQHTVNYVLTATY